MTRIEVWPGEPILERLNHAVKQALLPAFLLVSPFASRSTPLFLSILALFALLLCWRDLGQAIKQPRLTSLLWLPLALWLALSPLWAEAPAAAASRIASLAGLAMLGAIALLCCKRQPARMSIAALAGIVVAAALMLVYLQYPALAGERSVSDFNRSAISFAVIYWIPLLQLPHSSSRVERCALIGAALSCLAVVVASDTQSAILGLMIGHGVLAAAWLAPRLTYFALAVSSVVLMSFTSPLVALLAHPMFANLFQLEFVRHGTGGTRLRIWQEYLAMASDRFWLGYGPGTAPALEIKQRLVAAKGGGYEYFLNFVHPHNAFVQVWFDLGAVGAMLAALALFALFMRLQARLVASPLSMAMTASIIAIATVSHGLYQSWWIALVLLCLAYARWLVCDSAAMRKH